MEATMYFDVSVPIPEAKGKLVIKKKGAASYVLYEYERSYHKEKGYTIPRRAIIGKVVEADPGRMFPNEQYARYFPDVIISEELPAASRSSCLCIGPYLVIQKVLEEYSLPSMLRTHFGEHTGLLLDLISCAIVNEKNAGQYYPDYAFCHPLFTKEMRIYSDETVSHFLSSIQREQILGFLDDWNARRDHKQRIYVSCDSGNKNCQPGDISQAEFGKPIDERDFPVFNLSLVFDKTNRIPLFYEEYPGSISDVSQLAFLVDKGIEYGYEKIGFILDRGYFSRANIQYMDEKGFFFLLMIEGSKALVSDLIVKHRHSFESRRDCSIRPWRVHGTTIASKLYEEDKRERYFHIYFSAEKLAWEREQLEIKIDRMGQFLKTHEGSTATFSQMYKDYFVLHYSQQGKLLYAEERAEVIQKELELCGYFCLVSSEKTSAEEALTLYKGRDISEKLFAADKVFLESRSMSLQTEESIRSQVFVKFLALIVRNRIYTLLNESMQDSEKKTDFMTVPSALRELERIEIVRRNTGLYHLDHAMSEKQKCILSAFGLDVDAARQTAAQIVQTLAETAEYPQ
ncbi:MAG: transposase [Bacillota bacterium]|nr:transposase [Bacillota bacterium]